MLVTPEYAEEKNKEFKKELKGMTIREILKTHFYTNLNADNEIEEAVKKIRHLLMHDCCSVAKQVEAGMPNSLIVDTLERITV